jgi:hypothetical protein
MKINQIEKLYQFFEVTFGAVYADPNILTTFTDFKAGAAAAVAADSFIISYVF